MNYHTFTLAQTIQADVSTISHSAHLNCRLVDDCELHWTVDVISLFARPTCERYFQTTRVRFVPPHVQVEMSKVESFNAKLVVLKDYLEEDDAACFAEVFSVCVLDMISRM